MSRQHYVSNGVFIERREGCLKRQTKLKTVITFVMTVRFLCPSFNTRFTTRPTDSQSFMMIALKLWAVLSTQKSGYFTVVRDAQNGHFVQNTTLCNVKTVTPICMKFWTCALGVKATRTTKRHVRRTSGRLSKTKLKLPISDNKYSSAVRIFKNFQKIQKNFFSRFRFSIQWKQECLENEHF